MNQNNELEQFFKILPKQSELKILKNDQGKYNAQIEFTAFDKKHTFKECGYYTVGEAISKTIDTIQKQFQQDSKTIENIMEFKTQETQTTVTKQTSMTRFGEADK